MRLITTWEEVAAPVGTLAEQAEARLRYRYGLSETSGVVTVEARLTVERKFYGIGPVSE
jgi:hypothetical protein